MWLFWIGAFQISNNGEASARFQSILMEVQQKLVIQIHLYLHIL